MESQRAGELDSNAHQLGEDEDFIAFARHTMDEEILDSIPKDGLKRLKGNLRFDESLGQQHRPGFPAGKSIRSMDEQVHFDDSQHQCTPP